MVTKQQAMAGREEDEQDFMGNCDLCEKESGQLELDEDGNLACAECRTKI